MKLGLKVAMIYLKGQNMEVLQTKKLIVKELNSIYASLRTIELLVNTIPEPKDKRKLDITFDSVAIAHDEPTPQ
jgi:hypothetical protein